MWYALEFHILAPGPWIEYCLSYHWSALLKIEVIGDWSRPTNHRVDHERRGRSEPASNSLDCIIIKQITSYYIGKGAESPVISRPLPPSSYPRSLNKSLDKTILTNFQPYSPPSLPGKTYQVNTTNRSQHCLTRSCKCSDFRSLHETLMTG